MFLLNKFFVGHKSINKNRKIYEIYAFHKFSFVSRLKPNEAKCEIASIGVLKGVSLALCRVDCIDLPKKTIKVLGIYFSYNKKLETEENFIRRV